MRVINGDILACWIPNQILIYDRHVAGLDDQPRYDLSGMLSPSGRNCQSVITYLGASFVLLGMVVFLSAAIIPSNLGLSLAPGVVIFGMGTILSYIGRKTDRVKEPTVILLEKNESLLPLSYVASEVEKHIEEKKVFRWKQSLGIRVVIAWHIRVLLGFVWSPGGLAISVSGHRFHYFRNCSPSQIAPNVSVT